MRKRMMILCLGACGLLWAQGAMANYPVLRLLPRFQLAKAHVTYIQFQQDRDSCVKAATTRKWVSDLDGNASFDVSHNVFKFARCMQQIGYHSSPSGYDTGRLWPRY